MNEARELVLSGHALIDLVQVVLGRGSTVRIRAKGFSMSPFIKDGDIVVLSGLCERSPRLGDLVAFRIPDGDRLGVHRVTGKSGDFYLTRGDNCLEADGLVSRSSILGRVSGIERNGDWHFLGIGPERLVIAFLSRSGLLTSMTGMVRRIIGVCRGLRAPHAAPPTLS